MHLRASRMVTLTRKCPQSLHPYRGDQRKFQFWVNHSFTSVLHPSVREMSCVCSYWRFILANIKHTSHVSAEPSPLFSTVTTKSKFGMHCRWRRSTGNRVFHSPSLTSCSHYLLKKKGKKIQSTAHSELHPIRGRFGSLFLNCRVWRIYFSASMNLPLIKANSHLCSLSVLTDTFIVPAAHIHSLNKNTGGIFIGVYQHFLVWFDVERMLCRRGT